MENEEILIDGEFFRKVPKEKDVKEKDNYCVKNYKNIKMHNMFKNLGFNNNCEIRSNYDGDGINIDQEHIDKIVITQNRILVLLKGNEQNVKDENDDIIWSDKNGK